MCSSVAFHEFTLLHNHHSQPSPKLLSFSPSGNSVQVKH